MYIWWVYGKKEKKNKNKNKNKNKKSISIISNFYIAIYGFVFWREVIFEFV